MTQTVLLEALNVNTAKLIVPTVDSSLIKLHGFNHELCAAVWFVCPAYVPSLPLRFSVYICIYIYIFPKMNERVQILDRFACISHQHYDLPVCCVTFTCRPRVLKLVMSIYCHCVHARPFTYIIYIIYLTQATCTPRCTFLLIESITCI